MLCHLSFAVIRLQNAVKGREITCREPDPAFSPSPQLCNIDDDKNYYNNLLLLTVIKWLEGISKYMYNNNNNNIMIR